jgi:hypothetical protein
VLALLTGVPFRLVTKLVGGASDERPKPAVRTETHKKTPWYRKVLLIMAVAITAVALFLVTGEVLLRIIPIPGIEFNVTRPDSVVGLGKCPGSTLTYRNARGDFVRRRINRWGYLDREHGRENRAGSYRIGFFGDSFTEARQVPIEQTFFSLIEDSLKSCHAESFSFGQSGFSTLQSYLTFRRWASFFNFDMIVYVFCENDIGDQLGVPSNGRCDPYAVLTGDSFRVDNSFRTKCLARKYSIQYRVGDYLTSHSLVCATISSRLQLLLRYGVQPPLVESRQLAGEKAGDRTTKGRSADVVTRSPQEWPDSLRAYGQQLESAILCKWRDECRRDGRAFVVIHVPFVLEPAEGNYWKGWLEDFCRDQNIPFSDPMNDLVSMQAGGNAVFYDHFTKYGHVAFARSFVRWFRGQVRHN